MKPGRAGGGKRHFERGKGRKRTKNGKTGPQIDKNRWKSKKNRKISTKIGKKRPPKPKTREKTASKAAQARVCPCPLLTSGFRPPPIPPIHGATAAKYVPTPSTAFPAYRHQGIESCGGGVLGWKGLFRRMPSPCQPSLSN